MTHSTENDELTKHRIVIRIIHSATSHT